MPFDGGKSESVRGAGTDVLLIGGGIMGATLGTHLRELSLNGR